jgi:hypothetical protein
LADTAQDPQLATVRATLQLSVPLTAPQLFTSRAQNAASVSGTHTGGGMGFGSHGSQGAAMSQAAHTPPQSTPLSSASCTPLRQVLGVKSTLLSRSINVSNDTHPANKKHGSTSRKAAVIV